MLPDRFGKPTRSSAVTETAAVDLFAVLFVVASLSQAEATSRRVEPSIADLQETVIRLQPEGAFIANHGPFSDGELLQKVGVDKQLVKVRTSLGVSAERQNALLAKLSSNPAIRVTIDLSGHLPSNRKD